MSLIKKEAHYRIRPCGGIKASVKDVDMSGRIVTMILNTYNYLDSQGDVLLPNCAKKSIRDNGPKTGIDTPKIKHLLFHSWDKMTGKFLVLDERNIEGIDCIYAECYMPDTTDGNNALKNYEAQVYDNHSIGFNYLRTEFLERDTTGWNKAVEQLINPEEAERRNYMWLVKEIALWEGSTVGFGANSMTPCLGIKDGTPTEQKAELNKRFDILTKQLRSGTQTDDMLHNFDMQVRQIKQMIEDLDINDAIIQKDKQREKVRENKGPVPLFTEDDVRLYLGGQ